MPKTAPKSNTPTKPGHVWVSDRRVKGGGYFRKLPVGMKSPKDNSLADRPRQTSTSPQTKPVKGKGEGNFLKGVALLAGGAAMSGAVGAFATYWTVNKNAEKRVQAAQDEAQRRIETEVAQIKDELERTAPSRQVQKEVERRVRAAEDRINREAQEKIANERESAQQAARDAIVAASQPKARRPGDLITDDKDGVALAASVRQGLKLGTTPVSRANLDRRVNDATRRLATRYLDDGMQALASDFRAKADDVITNPKLSGDRGWTEVKKLVAAQNVRETALMDEVQSIQNRSALLYRQALEELHKQAEARGGYDADLLASFDRQSLKIHRAAKRDVAAYVRYVREDLKTKWDALRSDNYLTSYHTQLAQGA